MRVTEDIGGSTMRLDSVSRDWLGIVSTATVMTSLAIAGSARAVGSLGALVLVLICAFLAVVAGVVAWLGSETAVRITPHGVAVWRSWSGSDTITAIPFIPWHELDRVVSTGDWVELRGAALVRIPTAGMGPLERDLVEDRLRDALDRYRDLERGSDADRPRLERLTGQRDEGRR